MKILSICPSIYQHKFDKMIHSFEITSCKENSIVVINKKDSITKIFNETFEKYSDYDFYHLMNDDCIYETPLWDIKLAKKGKICYGDDLLQGENLPTFPMIDGDIARALGWLQMPTLERYCGDVVLGFIGKQLNILEYHPEVTIRHNWEGADANINTEDMRRFAEWLPWSFKDINRVKEIL